MIVPAVRAMAVVRTVARVRRRTRHGLGVRLIVVDVRMVFRRLRLLAMVCVVVMLVRIVRAHGRSFEMENKFT